MENEILESVREAGEALERATVLMRMQNKLIAELEATIERQKKELENERISAKQQFEIIKELRRKLETGLGGRYSRST